MTDHVMENCRISLNCKSDSSQQLKLKTYAGSVTKYYVALIFIEQIVIFTGYDLIHHK